MAGNTHANMYISPKFIEAKTAKELEEKMLTNNIKSNKQYHYTITVKGNKFYAWFDHDYTNQVRHVVRN